MVKGGYVPGRTHPTDRARGQTTAMPTAVAAARQSYADHPMVRLETAPPGPCHAVSLQETLSGTFTACATVILVLQSHIHLDSAFGLSISLDSSDADARTVAKFDGLHAPAALKPVICGCSTRAAALSSQARGHVHSEDDKRVGSPQRHRKAIHRCRKSAAAAVAGNTTGIDI